MSDRGRLVFWYAGMLVFWYAGILVFWYFGMNTKKRIEVVAF